MEVGIGGTWYKRQVEVVQLDIAKRNVEFHSVLCDVQTESLYIMQIQFGLQSVK